MSYSKHWDCQNCWRMVVDCWVSVCGGWVDCCVGKAIGGEGDVLTLGESICIASMALNWFETIKTKGCLRRRIRKLDSIRASIVWTWGTDGTSTATPLEISSSLPLELLKFEIEWFDREKGLGKVWGFETLRKDSWKKHRRCRQRHEWWSESLFCEWIPISKDEMIGWGREKWKYWKCQSR